ncbi:MAG: dihydrofolate reductase family protein [Thermoleophilia bacterium]|nr:dihydrofolate reductase family protein [Thermoleophilia bacterium]
MRRLLPEPGPTDPAAELAGYRPYESPREDRPFVAVNMITTLDGRAAIGGRSKDLGKGTDTDLLLALRTRFDAVLIGAGTLRAERYGRIVRDPQARARRERIGLAHDPLAVIVSGKLDLPLDAPLFTCGGGRILIFTNHQGPRPETATSLRMVTMEGKIRQADVLRHLRQERGIRALLCEGGPHLFGQLAAENLVDELFLTITPTLAGGEAPRIIEGSLEAPLGLELLSLAEAEGELFARYRLPGPA